MYYSLPFFTLQVTFSPRCGGSYEAVVAIFAHLVVNSSTESDRPVASVGVKAVAEEPQIEIETSLSGLGECLAIYIYACSYM